MTLPSRDPVVSALTGETLPGVTLELSPAYLALAPVLGVWDALTVLSIPQHLAVLGGMIAVFLLWRLSRPRTVRRSWVRALARECLALALFVGGVLAFYAVGAVTPRPMAALRVADPEVVVVDFHSHTSSSHDGRGSFTAERNRAWHRDSGYHVAYITDHDSVRAAVDAAALNPRRAGAGTIILPGREVVLRRQHVAVLGLVDPRAILASVGEGKSLADEEGRCPSWPVLVHTIPEDLSLVPVPDCPDGAGGVHAIELIDGAPRGLGQGDRERERILRIADSLDLAVVASSNLHGWARTASGWSLVRIPGWREMSPEQVGLAIEQKIRAEGRDAVEVVGHRRPVEGEAGLAVASLPVRFALDFVSQLSRAERLVWLLWIGLLYGAAVRFSDRRRDEAIHAL